MYSKSNYQIGGNRYEKILGFFAGCGYAAVANRLRKYRNGVLLNYSANFSTPYEGYHLAINGTRGRLETTEFGGVGHWLPKIHTDGQYIDYFPIFEGRERINIAAAEGGHGGGDPLILEDIFLGENPDRKYDILAKSVDGLRAIAIGDAVFTSIKEGGIKDLTGFIK